MSKSTYTMVISKANKTLAELTTQRSSQEDAHRIARQFFAENGVAGSKMVVKKDGTAIEQFEMDKDGWDYKVLNGTSVRAASRAASKTTKRTRKSAIAAA